MRVLLLISSKLWIAAGSDISTTTAIPEIGKETNAVPFSDLLEQLTWHDGAMAIRYTHDGDA